MAVLIIEVVVKLLMALFNGQLSLVPTLATSSQRLTPPSSFSQPRIWADISIQKTFHYTRILFWYVYRRIQEPSGSKQSNPL
jgi:hypothetical protein